LQADPTTETLVVVQHDGHNAPLFKVVETPNQVLVVVRLESGGEHLTLHRQKDGTILRTYWSSTKPEGTWDATNVAVARKLGYRDPERHGKYFAHSPLVEVQGMNAYELIGRRVKLDETLQLKARDQRLPRVTIDSPANEVMVYVHLSTPGRPYVPADAPCVATALGDIYVVCLPVGAHRGRSATRDGVARDEDGRE